MVEHANQVSQVISGHILRRKAKAFATLANIENLLITLDSRTKSLLLQMKSFKYKEKNTFTFN